MPVPVSQRDCKSLLQRKVWQRSTEVKHMNEGHEQGICVKHRSEAQRRSRKIKHKNKVQSYIMLQGKEKQNEM